MTIRDIPTGIVIKLYDDFQRQIPIETARCTVAVRKRWPGLSSIAVKHRVLTLLIRNVQQYRLSRKHLSAPRTEPMRSSPLEQIKVLTSILNPMGERTGGNYRARF